ncbi:MAG: High potential iron-sulfur protein [Woeseia sp.]|nr:high-potential iron-sulfur protein [Woeseia sp.]NNE61318.1 High potential iron-sulfur protein [Woeseia sp.]
MPRLAEDDPLAQSLSYVHDASSVDSAKQPRYESGQVCSNCALYTGGDGEEWGPCSIFPGKQVKASGWCSVYAPKA